MTDTDKTPTASVVIEEIAENIVAGLQYPYSPGAIHEGCPDLDAMQRTIATALRIYGDAREKAALAWAAGVNEAEAKRLFDEGDEYDPLIADALTTRAAIIRRGPQP